MLKKTILCILTCILTIALMCTISYQWVFANNNLIKNHSFEDVEGDALRFWETWVWGEGPGGVEFTVEKDNPRSGQNCAAIYNLEERGSRYIQKVEVEPDSQYKFSAWIRTENVGEGRIGANISVVGNTIYSQDIKGTTHQWEYVELYIKTMEEVDSVELILALGGYDRLGADENLNTGKAFFDDVALEKVDSIPEGARVVVVEKDAPKSSEKDVQSGPEKRDTEGKYTWIWLLVSWSVLLSVFIYYVKTGKVKFKR